MGSALAAPPAAWETPPPAVWDPPPPAPLPLRPTVSLPPAKPRRRSGAWYAPHRSARWWATTSLPAIAGVVILAAVAAAPHAAPYRPVAAHDAAARDLQRSTQSTTAAPAPVNDVIFSCAGNAPSGVQITYGSDSSNNEAADLPFTASERLAYPQALYYDITAQLDGAGSVTCKVTVNWIDATGVQQSVTKSRATSAAGGIAAPEVCGDFNRGWHVCG